jgi:hypothetical protein
MTSNTDTEFSPSVESFSGARTELIEATAEVARQSINTYFTGMKVFTDQQRFTYWAVQQWIAGANAQARLTQRLVERYGAASSELVEICGKALQSSEPVLQKLASMPGQEPVPGYDELGVREIQKLIADGDVELATRVRDYERPRKRREGVLHAADAQLSKS